MSKLIINKLSDKEKREMGILTWAIWKKEISRFSWTYSENEQCYIIDGEFTVETDEGNFSVSAGDFVIFKKGLSCVWDIRKPIKKYYNFS